MGRPALALFCGLLVLCGCAAPQPSPRTSAAQRWSRICASLRAAHAAADAERPGVQAELSAEEQSALTSVAAGARPALVQIRTHLRSATAGSDRRDGAIQMAAKSGGTGVIIALDGIILTNEHVLRDAETIHVVFADGRKCEAAAVAADATLDLAVLRVAAQGFPALKLGDQPVRTGTPVVALAALTASGGDRACCGVVLAPSVSLQSEIEPSAARDYHALIESTTALEPGFSGGPLLDSAGRFIGLNVAACTRSGGERRGYALPLDDGTCRTIARLVAATDQR